MIAAGKKAANLLFVYNPTSGSGDFDAARCWAHFAQLDINVTPVSAKSNHLRAALSSPVDAIIVYGGDGTLTRVLQDSIRPIPPIALIPQGTANNFARSFGIRGTLEGLLSRYIGAGTVSFRLAEARMGVSSIDVVESAGCGVIARAIRKVDSQKEVDDSVVVCRKRIEKLLRSSEVELPTVTVDGDKLPPDILFVEIMNIQYAGPILHLAPGYTPGTEHLTVTYAAEEDRSALISWLTTSPDTPPPARIRRASCVNIAPSEEPVRINDQILDILNAPLSLFLGDDAAPIMIPNT